MTGFFLNNKGAFAFSDPGAAKAVLALLHQLKKNGYKNYMAISDRAHSFYPQFNVNVEACSVEKMDNLLDLFNPDYVFTGTSYSSRLELKCISFANRKSIPSYSFIDHWTSLNDRFKMNGQCIYPENVLVIDQRAFDIAVQEGIPKQLLRIFPNPYYDFVQHWTPAVSKEDFLKKHGMDFFTGKIISYVPEPLSNVGGLPQYGLDEYYCLELLCRAMQPLKSNNFTVLIKPHPNQDKEKLSENALFLAAESGIGLKMIEEDTNTLLYYSDLVVGIFSNALVEASFFKKPVFRILKGLAVADPLASMNVGTCAYSEDDLTEELKKHL